MSKFKIFLCVSFLLLSAMEIYAQVTHTVTTNADAGNGSLRQAVIAANSGDSIVFASDVNYITLTSGEINITKNLTIVGHSPTNKVTIDADSNSRIFYVDRNLTFDINNLILTKGYANKTAIINKYDGGAILLLHNSNLNATNCDFIENYAKGDIDEEGNGGAICFSVLTTQAVTLNIANCNFLKNSASRSGGAIYIYQVPSFTLNATNCDFIENTTSGIGSSQVYDGGGGAISLETGTIIAENCNFIQNYAYKGAAIYNWNAINSKVSNCNFTLNSAVTSGSAIDYHGRFTAENSTFKNNKSGTSGGAVRCYYASTFIATDCIFSENSAGTTGGAIDKSWGSNSSTEYDAGLVIKNCDFLYNTAGTLGGAIHIVSSAADITDSEFSNNTADGSGGAVYISSTMTLPTPPVFVANNTTFSNNTATVNGGAVYTIGDLKCTDCIFNENSANNAGGAVYLFNNPTNTTTNFTASNSTFTKNTATSDGGAISATSSNLTAENCTFAENSIIMNHGGAVNLTNSTFTATNCVFDKNSVVWTGGSSAQSGAVSADNSIFTALNCTFNENFTRGDGGGALTISNGSNVYLYHCTFDKNHSPAGNAIFSYSADIRLYIYNCIFMGNTPQMLGDGYFTIGEKLEEGINGVTRDMVFGNNEFNPTVGYIVPLSYAVSAPQLNNSIQVPAGTTANEILAKLATDQKNDSRPLAANGSVVTFGSVEVEKDALPKPTFTLTVTANAGGTTTPSGTSTVDSGTVATLIATANDCYEFVNWVNENGDAISSVNPLTVTISSDTSLTATFKYICDTSSAKFTIRASEHPLTDPRRRNYRVPIYITASENVSGMVIEKLIIEVDRSLYFPRRVDNGTMAVNNLDTMFETTFTNVIVPALQANRETILLTVRGDVILADKDSGDIIVKSVTFSEALAENPLLVNGYITLDTCVGRLLTFDYEPSLTVKNNPVIDKVLSVECQVIENGNYSLDIVDLQGKVATVAKWTVDTDEQNTFNFEISVLNYGNGSYLLILHTPSSAKFLQKFIINK